MKIRTYIYLCLCIATILIFSSCSDPVKVGLLMDHSEFGRWPKDKELLIENIELAGGEVFFKAAQGDSKKQYIQAQELIAEEIDVLILIATNMNDASKIVKNANDNGIKVIAYDRLVKNCNLDFYISFDHVNIGELQAKYTTTIRPRGKYAIIGGSATDNNSFFLHLGQMNILQPLVSNGDINIVFDEFASECKPEDGYLLMKKCLDKYNDIDVVIAANDRLAGGVLRAIRESNIGREIAITGMDADVEACQRIVEGSQSMTVYKPIKTIARKTAEIAIKIAEGYKIPTGDLSLNNGYKQVPTILLPSIIVFKENLEQTVIADGYINKSDIYR
jgi:D-xylose transport system substrate-binding protein